MDTKDTKNPDGTRCLFLIINTDCGETSHKGKIVTGNTEEYIDAKYIGKKHRSLKVLEMYRCEEHLNCRLVVNWYLAEEV